MSTRSNRQLRLDLINNLIGCAVQGSLAWGASLIDAVIDTAIDSGVWLLFAANLAGGAVVCAVLAFVTVTRLILRRIRKR